MQRATVLLTLLALLGRVLDALLPHPAALGFATVAAATLALMVCLVAGSIPLLRLLGPTASAGPGPATRREYAWLTAFMPQRDPDGRGRSRPRAPSAASRAAGSASRA
ncbi:DUF6412 domain-containing protein [Streptacidiphilus fuscans]|uniref:Uncharacterized protein n=1 Tax=Streptacidiphilus fuscans TaxID=2789292 RepID=A0A931FGF5_9ACTN|nr:DUF6412 domain-containing protein [Streptacidiphilus fuscans]MBF9069484.1 hypothetical protein [Streptacidiphilus fuscans]